MAFGRSVGGHWSMEEIVESVEFLKFACDLTDTDISDVELPETEDSGEYILLLNLLAEAGHTVAQEINVMRASLAKEKYIPEYD